MCIHTDANGANLECSAAADRRVLVRGRDDGETGAVVDEPCPTGAESFHAGVVDLTPELVEPAERRLDRCAVMDVHAVMRPCCRIVSTLPIERDVPRTGRLHGRIVDVDANEVATEALSGSVVQEWQSPATCSCTSFAHAKRWGR